MAGGVRPLILLLCGPVAVGKSSIARRLGELLPDSRVISTDAYKRKVYLRLIEEMLQSQKGYRYVILDGTFYRKEWRECVREVIGDEERVLTILLRAPLKLCLERNSRRPRPIPERAVYIIYREFEWPERADLEIEMDKIDVEGAVKLILERVRELEDEP
jgi:tRNA uridine 5-carbamoylmethylation protein Kti12